MRRGHRRQSLCCLETQNARTWRNATWRHWRTPRIYIHRKTDRNMGHPSFASGWDNARDVIIDSLRSALRIYSNLCSWLWRQRTPLHSLGGGGGEGKKGVTREGGGGGGGGGQGNQVSARRGEGYVTISQQEIVRCVCATRFFLGGKSSKKWRGHCRRVQKLVSLRNLFSITY